MSDKPGDLDLDAIEARANAATPGPWVDDDEPYNVDGDDGELVANVYTLSRYRSEIDANRRFIAAARSDMPALVAAVRARDEEIARLKAALKPFADAGDLFSPQSVDDLSIYVGESDDAPIGNRRCWETTPLTIGHLRAAHRASKP